jgi:DNA-binding CsgD family transcriptional regulator
MASDVKDLSRIANSFVEAAIDPSRWDGAMEVVAEATESFGALLIPCREAPPGTSRNGSLPNIPKSPEMAGSFEAYIRERWVERDERYRALPSIVRRGVGTEFDFTTPDDIARHPYYQEFLRPHGLRWFAGVKVASADDVWCLSIQRSIAQGPFSVREQERLAVLSRHLSGAAAIARAFGFARAEAALEAFEISGSAAVLLDRCGSVLRLNAAAEQLLGADLRIVAKRLVARDTAATMQLDRALHRALWTRTSAALMPPVALPRIEGRPILAYAARLAHVSADALAPCQALVILVDLAKRFRPPEESLRSSFGLTTAEARLATRLASGDSLDAAADALRITKETARSQLKAVFEKTGVHRQSEFVALLARMLNSNEIPPTRVGEGANA